MESHVVLLGDSVFDNARYVQPGPDVVTHLHSLLPADWSATLCAVDGATSGGLAAQLRRVPADATHLVISIGGNDALQNMDLLSLPVDRGSELLEAFAERLAIFRDAYGAAVSRAVALGLPTTLCTIYNGNLEPERAVGARLGVALFDDVILGVALDAKLDVIELRSVCSEAADYANPIEPSVRGGLKIARAIASAVGALPSSHPRCVRLCGSPTVR